MKVNESLEQKLWSITRPNPLDRETFIQVVNYVFNRLREHLQQPLEIVGEDTINEDSFSRSFRIATVPHNPFEITFVGLLELGLVGDEFKPHINAWVFLFGSHHRLIAGQPSRSYTEFVYDKIDVAKGQWRSLGWMLDDYGQFESIEEDFR